jgi:hypothetical protein
MTDVNKLFAQGFLLGLLSSSERVLSIGVLRTTFVARFEGMYVGRSGHLTRAFEDALSSLQTEEWIRRRKDLDFEVWFDGPKLRPMKP